MERGYTGRTQQSHTGQIAGWAFGVAAFLGLFTLFMGYYTVAQHERGVITRNGAFLRIAEPGFGVMMPFIDTIHRIDMRQINPKFPDMEMYSADRQLAKIDASVILAPKPHKLKELFSEYKTVEYAISKLIAPIMPAEIKVVFGRYTAERSIKERDKLNVEAKERIISILGDSSLFNVYLVPIEDIEFSKEYVKSVEERMKAEVEVDRIRQQWEQEKLRADIVKTQADAAAYQVEVKGKAEAMAIDLVGKALAQNPKYVEKIQAERWDGKLPTTMVPNATMPFMSIK